MAKHTGAHGEEIAAQLLQQKGYRILARNWRSRHGEIDLIATSDEILVVVEVKTRTSSAFGFPEEAVTRAKQRKLIKTGWSYLVAHGISDVPWRIDVVAIEVDDAGRPKRVEHYVNAVDDLDLG